jgi:ATP-dependent RNA helicase SrmB
LADTPVEKPTEKSNSPEKVDVVAESADTLAAELLSADALEPDSLEGDSLVEGSLEHALAADSEFTQTIESFAGFALHKQLYKALEKMQFETATEVQSAAIPIALSGRDIMVSAKTGSGKTAAFLLPMLKKMLTEDAPGSGTRGLILLPTRELALQTQKMFEKLARFCQIRCGLIIGGEAFKYQVATLRKNPEVVIATPGRLVDHIEKGSTDFRDLEFLVLDEADRMLDMGFSEDMTLIASRCPEDRQSLLFSATLKHKSIGRVLELLNDPVSIEVDSYKEGHSNIVQEMVLADDDQHKEKLVAALVKEEDAKKVFVFCRTRNQCEQVGQRLAQMDMKVGYIHGEIPQSDRKQVLNRFRDDKLQILVATDVAARGLDVTDVDLVINFTVAHSGDDHVHRVGRTGRAGKEGKAITLVSDLEWNKNSSIERYLKIRFEHREVGSLKAKYKGPKKLKKSGKAAGPKRKKDGKNLKSAKAKPPVKKHQARKNKSLTAPEEKKASPHAYGSAKKMKVGGEPLKKSASDSSSDANKRYPKTKTASSSSSYKSKASSPKATSSNATSSKATSTKASESKGAESKPASPWPGRKS